GYALTPLSRFGGQANPALFLPKGMLKPAPLPTGLAYYDAIGSLMAANPPPKSERKLMRLFASVGIVPGRTPFSAHRDQATRERPPVKAFWSLTMYDKDLFLVPNPLARYAFGDRTSGLKHNPDGSLDILVQHFAPKHHRANWLPAPAGTFVLALRLYQPKPNV